MQLLEMERLLSAWGNTSFCVAHCCSWLTLAARRLLTIARLPALLVVLLLASVSTVVVRVVSQVAALLASGAALGLLAAPATGAKPEPVTSPLPVKAVLATRATGAHHRAAFLLFQGLAA